MKVCLDSVSYGGIFYKGPKVPLKDLIFKAKDFGYDGIEIQARRPLGSVLDWDSKAGKDLKETADSAGIEIAAVSATNNFASPIMEERENELLMVREQIKFANNMDAKVMRVFAAWMGTLGPDRRTGLATLENTRITWNYPASFVDRWLWVVDGLKEAAKWAEEYGVTLALQTHGPILRPGYEDTLFMIRQVNSEYLKMSLDTGLACFNQYEHQSDGYIRKAVQACKDVVVHSHFNAKFDETPSGEVVQIPYDIPEVPGLTPPGGSTPNYLAFVRELKKIGYRGYHSYEVCSQERDENYNVIGIEMVDKYCRLACRYMKKLIREA